MSDYYYIKYQYKNYRSRDQNGSRGIMFSVPVYALAEMYRARMGKNPTSFFDLGCATGEIMMDAKDMGMQVSGIDIAKYPIIPERNQNLFDDGDIQIKSILNYGDVKSDLVFANGPLSYLTKFELDKALEHFKKSKMIISIHNTTEDYNLARMVDQPIYSPDSKIIESESWWLNKFESAGFKVDLDKKYDCFCAIPKTR